MTIHASFRSFVLASMVVAACGWEAAAQAVDPAEMLQRSARTRVTTRVRTAQPSQSPKAASGTMTSAQRKPVAVVAKLTPATAITAATIQQKQSAAARTEIPPTKAAAIPTLVIIATIGISLVGTTILLVAVNRFFQNRARRQRKPSVIAPIPFAPAVPTPAPKPIEPPRHIEEPEEEQPSHMVETAERYQRGRGEMDLALAIERLKRELPAPQKRVKAIPKSKNARIAAAKKMGKGSGEMELALRLERLRNATKSEANVLEEVA